MIISDEEVEIVKRHESKFVSLKYIDLIGNLFQFDIHSRNFINDAALFINKPLKIISHKAFFDPFRSFPTTSFLCENIIDKINIRAEAALAINQYHLEQSQNFALKIHFWLEDRNDKNDISNDISIEKNYLFISDPEDKYANLRADIVECLENLNIKTNIHYHGKSLNESVIGIISNNLLELIDNYIITKFIITNIAYNYGQNIKFNQDGYNLEAEIIFDGAMATQFYNNMLNNSSKIISYFSPIEIDRDYIQINMSEKFKSVKILITTAAIFNPYIAIIALIGYGIVTNFEINQIFTSALLKEYKMALDTSSKSAL